MVVFHTGTVCRSDRFHHLVHRLENDLELLRGRCTPSNIVSYDECSSCSSTPLQSVISSAHCCNRVRAAMCENDTACLASGWTQFHPGASSVALFVVSPHLNKQQQGTSSLSSPAACAVDQRLRAPGAAAICPSIVMRAAVPRCSHSADSTRIRRSEGHLTALLSCLRSKTCTAATRERVPRSFSAVCIR